MKKFRTKQELFNQVVAHFLQMPGQSHTNIDGCLYYGPEGNRCFIGGMLTIEDAREAARISEYDPNSGALGSFREMPMELQQVLMRNIPEIEDGHLRYFLTDLQICHDFENADDRIYGWKKATAIRLIEIAKVHNLQFSELLSEAGLK